MMDENNDLKRGLSSLLDAGLEGQGSLGLLDRLENDEELKAILARYQLMGDVMRSPRAMVADDEFARRVSAAIREEPTALAPTQNLQGRGGAIMRHKLVTFAMAASLAGLALLVGKSLTGHFLGSSANPQTASAVDANSFDSIENMADAQFNDYLLVHNHSAYMAGSAGMLPDVRLVSSGPDR